MMPVSENFGLPKIRDGLRNGVNADFASNRSSRVETPSKVDGQRATDEHNRHRGISQ